MDDKDKILEYGLDLVDTTLTPENWAAVLLGAAADCATVTEAWVQTEFQNRGWIHITSVGALVPWGGDCRSYNINDPHDFSD
jgi:hypothetical protein